MNIYFFIVKSKYRATHFNNFFNKKIYVREMVVKLEGIFALLFENVLFKVSKYFKNITLIYTDSEFPNRLHSQRLWWNDPGEIKDIFLSSCKNILMCGVLFNNTSISKFQLYPVNIKKKSTEENRGGV